MVNYLLVENGFKSFGDMSLFNDITFSVNEGDKTALIAKNGAGKTTLLNIIAGKDSLDAGNCVVNKDIKLAYLEQDPKFDPSLTMFQAVYGKSGELMDAVREYELALHHHNSKNLEKAIASMDFHQAWDLDSKIKTMLGVLRLSDEDQLVGSLSGGQVKRLALAVTLLNEPQFLILDEPTNHLDLEMIEWLEEYLSKSQITLLMVTHDRYFLDRICNEIVEIDEKTTFLYKGNYSYFIQHRNERLLNQSQKAEKARNLMRNELEWMRRMPKARTTKAKYRIDAFYDLKKQSEYRRSDREVEINVQTSRMGKKILVMDGISKSFGETAILDNFSYTFKKKEKLGIIGKNGVGKTTFLNIITGKMQPDSGRIEQGETVVYGYYQQQGLEFDSGQRVIDILKEIAEYVTLADGKQLSVSQFLNHFLFTPEMQYVRIDKLSGGEKRRLYLMTVLMRNPNFLVLDEPTNDFDIVTLNVLEDYLAAFGGCLIIVSHDRFFMDKLVDHLFIFEGEGEVYDFPGNYSDYRATLKEQESASNRNDKENAPKNTSSKPEANQDAGKRKLSFREKKELEQLTIEIEELEKEKSLLETEISSGTINHEELLDKSNRLGELIAEIDQKSDRWLELSE
ncbi:MAG: ABC-F family ATP-binding cassette domain-containing protein [Cyclobacteriaceae bacterium]|nr:ABC-F family ATP-binding cassette domain-containing protein [Cyclobacteriaceae bacterium]